MGHLFFELLLELMNNIIKLIEDYCPEPFEIWMGPYFGISIVKPDDVQVIIFQNNTNHTDIIIN